VFQRGGLRALGSEDRTAKFDSGLENLIEAKVTSTSGSPVNGLACQLEVQTEFDEAQFHSEATSAFHLWSLEPSGIDRAHPLIWP
jgi:hypothetical protein